MKKGTDPIFEKGTDIAAPKSAAPAVLLFAAFLFTVPASAGAACGTQGALALALAQTLGKVVLAEGPAMTVLTDAGVSPAAGWRPEQCLTAGNVEQLRRALDDAVTRGAFSADAVSGALETALHSVGESSMAGGAEADQPRRPAQQPATAPAPESPPTAEDAPPVSPFPGRSRAPIGGPHSGSRGHR